MSCSWIRNETSYALYRMYLTSIVPHVIYLDSVYEQERLMIVLESMSSLMSTRYCYRMEYLHCLLTIQTSNSNNDTYKRYHLEREYVQITTQSFSDEVCYQPNSSVHPDHRRKTRNLERPPSPLTYPRLLQLLGAFKYACLLTEYILTTVQSSFF